MKRTLTKTLFACLAIALWTFATVQTSQAQVDSLRATEDEDDSVAVERLTDIALEQLPDPPKDLVDLLSRGKVSFRYGPRELLNRDEPDFVTNRWRRLAAETRFQLKYIYRTRTQWRIRDKGDLRELVISVSYDSIETTFHHDVWFLEQPPKENFWNDRLVGHELDHVRISMHPMIEKSFKKKVRAATTLTEAIDDETEVTKSMVRQIVEKHVQSAFDETIALVRVRYQDLDLVTNHGLRPIPLDSEPMNWIISAELASRE